MNAKIKSPEYIIKLAQEMRRNPEPCEKLLWDRLKEKQINGFKFRRQHPVYRYILDFYCHEKKIAIEVDGMIHSQRKDYDDYRDDFLKSIGIETLRFTNNEILTEIDAVLEKIKAAL